MLKVEDLKFGFASLQIVEVCDHSEPDAEKEHFSVLRLGESQRDEPGEESAGFFDLWEISVYLNFIRQRSSTCGK